MWTDRQKVKMTAREKPSFTFGIEEEYFLVDPRTRAIVSEPPKSVLDECKAELGGHVSAEYQRSPYPLHDFR